MKKITIRWQRLVNKTGQTCQRCSDTEYSVESACKKLRKSLSGLNIEVELKKEALDFLIFTEDPLQSNRIWIGEKPLEEWIGATIGKSRCCAVCGNSECLTISTDQSTFEAIPENLIVCAGLLAAAELLIETI